ncbi:lonely Cys domain-containing protein, partial [Streptomyces sp. NPDC048279]|uniref:lonely Cys domain-containing protein n=1 Tax=Streptomyces sp. NPDC048279 TaxID=3154714 RepID=UPI0034203C16
MGEHGLFESETVLVGQPKRSWWRRYTGPALVVSTPAGTPLGQVVYTDDAYGVLATTSGRFVVRIEQSGPARFRLTDAADREVGTVDARGPAGTRRLALGTQGGRRFLLTRPGLLSTEWDLTQSGPDGGPAPELLGRVTVSTVDAWLGLQRYLVEVDPRLDAGSVAVGQHVANATGRRVTAPTRVIGTVTYGAGNDVRLIRASAQGVPGRLVTFVPEPSGADLDGLARVAGLHAGGGPASEEVRSVTLRLVRALRTVFDTDVEADRNAVGGSYQGLLEGMGALEAMRAADPDLGPMTPFTLDLLRQVAKAYQQSQGRHGGEPGEAVYRAVLETAARYAAPGMALSRFVPLPVMQAAARLLRHPEARAGAAAVLGLRPLDGAEQPEHVRSYWAVVRAQEVLGGVHEADLGALAAKVLHLPSGTQLDGGLWDRLFWRVAAAVAAGCDVTSPSVLAAFDLEQRGAFEESTRIVDHRGLSQGRTWSGRLAGSLDVAVVHEFATEPSGGLRLRRIKAGPWTRPLSGRPGAVVWTLQARSSSGGILMRWPDGSQTAVPDDEIVELLARDPDLMAMPLERPLLLAVPSAAAGGLPQALASRLGRRVWSHADDARVSPGQRGLILALVRRDNRAGGSLAMPWLLTAPPGKPVDPQFSGASSTVMAGAGISTGVHDALLGEVFGPGILADVRLEGLRAAADRLEELLPLGETGLAEALDGLVASVLHLPASAEVTGAQRALLFSVVEQGMAAGRAGNLDELAAVYVSEDALSPGTAIADQSGHSAGRNWGAADVDGLITDTVWVYAPDGRNGFTRRKVNRAGWYRPGGPAPYVVVAEGGFDHVVVPGAGGSGVALSAAAFAELLDQDVDLAALGPDVPVVLVVPDAGGEGLDLPRTVAHRLGRMVWAASGEARLHSVGRTRRKAVALIDRNPGLPLGRWIPSSPDGPGPVVGDKMVTALDRTVFRDSDIHTRTVITADGQVLGRQFMPDHDHGRLREGDHARLKAMTRIYHLLPPPLTGAAPSESLDLDYSALYHFNAHGAPGLVEVPLKDGRRKLLSGSEIGRVLARRPSVRNLPAHAGIFMETCWAGAATDWPGRSRALEHGPDPVVMDPLGAVAVAQNVANATGRWVTAPTRVIGANVLRVGGGRERLIIASAQGVPGRLVTFMPEPSGADLDGLARTAGLHTGWGPASQEVRSVTLRLVRALRTVFGTEVEKSGPYRQLLEGIGALEAMRAGDPDLNQFTSFTLDLFTHVVDADRGRSGTPDDAEYRQVLERARNMLRTAPGTVLSSFVPLARPLGDASALLRRRSDIPGLAASVLRLGPGHRVGEAERTRLYWALVKAYQATGDTARGLSLAPQVLHLAPGTPLDGRVADRLFDVVAKAVAAGRDVTNPAALAAFDLRLRGAFASATSILGPQGKVQGRSWVGGQLVGTLDASVVHEVVGKGSSGRWRGSEQAPWPRTPDLWVLCARARGGRLVLSWPDGSRTSASDDEVVELLRHDPGLEALPLAAPVVLAVPGLDPEGLPVALARGLGRQVWSHSGRLAAGKNGANVALTLLRPSDHHPSGKWNVAFPPGHPGSSQAAGPGAQPVTAGVRPDTVSAVMRAHIGSAPGGRYDALLGEVFGPGISADARLEGLRAAVGRLDALRPTGDAGLAGTLDAPEAGRTDGAETARRSGALAVGELDALAVRVLHLDRAPADVHADVRGGWRSDVADMLELVGSAADTGRADSLAALEALHLEQEGAYDRSTALAGPDGRIVGRNWSGARVGKVDLGIVSVATGTPDGAVTVEPGSTAPAPWLRRANDDDVRGSEALGQAAYACFTGGVRNRRITVTVNGRGHLLDTRVLAELVAHDPDRATGAPVVYGSSYPGRRGLELARAMAEGSRATVWSSSGDLVLIPGDIPGGSLHLARIRQQSASTPGRWTASPPGLEAREEQDPAGLSLYDRSGRRIPVAEADVQSHTLVGTDHQSAGVALFSTEEWPRREVRVGDVSALTQYVHLLPAGRTTGSPKPLPWTALPSGQPVYTVIGHGSGQHLAVNVTTGDGPGQTRVMGADAHQVLGILRRRPSLARLDERHPGGEKAVLPLLACGGPKRGIDPLETVPLAQKLATLDNRVVFAAPTRVKASNARTLSLVVGPRGEIHDWIRFRPEPVDGALDDLARTMGLHAGTEAAPQAVRDQALRLVRALRRVFGPDADSDLELVAGTGALERLRQADPVFAGTGPFTMEFLGHAAGQRPPQPGLVDPAADTGPFRTLLAQASKWAQAAPGTGLTLHLPLRQVSAAAAEWSEGEARETLARRILHRDADQLLREGDYARAFWSLVAAHGALDGRTPAELAALAAGVLHLDGGSRARRVPGAGLRLRIAQAIAADRRDVNPAAWAAYDLGRRGYPARGTELRDANGTRVGQNLTAQPVGFLDPTRVRISPKDGADSLAAAPWPKDSFTVVVTGGKAHVSLHRRGTPDLHVPFDEVAELLAEHRDLAGTNPVREITLIFSPAGPDARRLAQAVADATGRAVWVPMRGEAVVAEGTRTAPSVIVLRGTADFPTVGLDDVEKVVPHRPYPASTSSLAIDGDDGRVMDAPDDLSSDPADGPADTATSDGDIPHRRPTPAATAERIPSAEQETPDPGPEEDPGAAPEPGPASPWYLDHDALGAAWVSSVGPWTAEDAATWGGQVADATAATGDSAELTRGIQDGLRELLSTTDPRDWETLLRRGRLLVAGGRLVWLRPVVREAQAVRKPDDAIRKYGVGFASTKSGHESEHAITLGLDAAVLTTLQMGSRALSSLVLGMPHVEAQVTDTRGRKQERSLIAGRQLIVADSTPFRAQLTVLVFVDGVERPHGVVVPRDLVVELPSVLAVPNGARPDHGTPAVDGTAGRRPMRARGVLNAVDLIPVAAALQRTLLDAGLGPDPALRVMEESLGLLNEQSARNRSTAWFSNGVLTRRVRIRIGPASWFDGYLSISAQVRSLQYLANAPGTGIRDDMGTGLAVGLSRRAESKAALGVGLNLLGLNVPGARDGHAKGPAEGPASRMQVTGFLPALSVRGMSQRGTSHGMTEQTLGHTVLSSTGNQSRYRSELEVSVEIRSTTHDVPTVTEAVEAEVGVPRREAADFESRLLGAVHTPALRAGGSALEDPVAARPHVRALLRAANLPLSRSAYRRPADLDAPLPAPHPREPRALASRRGQGFGMAVSLPGAELVHDQIRQELVRRNTAASGDKIDWSLTDQDLLTWFSRPALEADLPRLLVGFDHAVKLGNQRYQVAVKGHLLRRVDGGTYPMTVNARALEAVSVKGRRHDSTSYRGESGAGPRFAWGRVLLQLGSVGVRGAYTRGGEDSFSGAAKSYRRTETTGQVDEHVYQICYEMTVRPLAGGPRTTWWINQPEDVVAQVVVPEEHAPASPLKTTALTGVGVATELKTWPAGPHVNLPDGGTSGLYAAFLSMPELPRLAAEMYAKANDLTDTWAADPLEWPAELKNMTLPSTLAARLDSLTTGRFGHLVELPTGRDGYKQVVRLRLRGYRPRYQGPRPTTELEHYVQGLAQHQRGIETGWEAGPRLALGVFARFSADAGSGQQDSQDPQSGHRSGSGATADSHGSAALTGGRLQAALHGGMHWKNSLKSSVTQGNIDISRATYGGTNHAYTLDPVFEITLVRWKGDQRSENSRYLRVSQSLDLLVPERRVFDLGLTPPGTTGPVPRPPTGGHHPMLLANAGYPERMRADDVLTRIVEHLQGRGIVREEPRWAEPRPNLLMRELVRSFSSEALRTQYSALMGSGVRRWLPVPQVFGATQYLWVCVSAATAPAETHLPRPEVKLTLRSEGLKQTVREDTASLGGTVGFVGYGLLRHGTGDGGLSAGGGFARSTESAAEKHHKRLEIYRANPREGSDETDHPLRFRIEMGLSTQLPELLDRPVRGARRIFVDLGDLTGRGKDAADWWYSHRPFLWHDVIGTDGQAAASDGASADGTADAPGGALAGGDRPVRGTVRLLMPGHLMTEGLPTLDTNPVHGSGAAWEHTPRPPRSPAEETALRALAANLHPWKLPASGAVRRWAAVTAAPFKPPADLAAPEAWRVPGLDFSTVAGLVYEDYTGHGMLRAGTTRLLEGSYAVPVGRQEVRVALEITRARRLPLKEAVFKGRYYTQDSEGDEHRHGSQRGHYLLFGPEAGGEPDHGALVLEDSPGLWELQDAESGSGETGETHEQNRESTRRYRHYVFDVDVVLTGPRGTARVHAAGGLYGMLPLEQHGDAHVLADGLETSLAHLFADLEEAADPQHTGTEPADTDRGRG